MAPKPLSKNFAPKVRPSSMLSADLASPDAPDRLVQAARDAFGHLDIVVANHARSSTRRSRS